MKKYYNFLNENKQQDFFNSISGSIRNKFLDFLDSDFSELKIYEFNDEEIIFYCSNKFIEDKMGIENGILEHISYIDSYGYEYYIDEDSEKEFIYERFNDKSKKMLKHIFKFLDLKIPKNKEELGDYLKNHGFQDVLDAYTSELSYINKNAVKKKIDKEIDKETFFYKDYVGHRDLIAINFSSLLKFMNKYKNHKYENLTDAFIALSEELPYNFDIEYEHYDYIDYSSLSKEIQSALEFYWNEDYGIKDRFWIDLFRNDDNVNLIKKWYKLIEWENTVRFFQEGYKLYHDIPDKNSKIYKLIWSDEFIDKLKNLDSIDKDFIFELTHREMRKKANEFNL